MLQPGDLVPHFRVTNLAGQPVAYATIWQHTILVLIAVPGSDPDGSVDRYVSQFAAHEPSFMAAEAACVITQEAVAGVACPGVVVADRWGEVIHVAFEPQVAALPSPGELLDWVDYVRMQCPECQGEAK